MPIAPDDTVESLWGRMSVIGAELLLDTMRAGFTDAMVQSGEVVYASPLSTDELRLEWDQPAELLHRVVRVGDAWTTFRGERFKVHEARVVEARHRPGSIEDLVVGTGDGGLELVVVQPAGKPRMAARDWANGARPDGEVLGERADV